MAADEVQLQADGSGKRVDANTLTSTMTGTPTVYRQVINIGDPATFANVAAVAAKGTQGAFALATQDLHDSGRNVSNLFMVIPVVTTTGEVMMSLTGYKSGAAVAATATPAVVTAGKTLRVQSVLLTYIATATAGQVKFTLRANLTGVAIITSPLVAVWELGQNAAVAGVAQTQQLSFEDGLEFAAGTGIAIGMQGLVAPGTGTVVGYGQITIHGYEF